MDFTKKLYLLFFLVLGTASLSYVSFAYAPIPPQIPSDSQIKGLSIAGPFAFLPSPVEAQEISATYAPDIVNISFIIEEKCSDAHSYYYETILEDRGWQKVSSEVVEDDLLTSYIEEAAGLFLNINFFTENSQNMGETCLVNLVGGIQ